MKSNHPYLEYKDSSAWYAVQRALHSLTENNDLILQTNEKYVIGYICHIIKQEEGLFFSKRPNSAKSKNGEIDPLNNEKYYETST